MFIGFHKGIVGSPSLFLVCSSILQQNPQIQIQAQNAVIQTVERMVAWHCLLSQSVSSMHAFSSVKSALRLCIFLNELLSSSARWAFLICLAILLSHQLAYPWAFHLRGMLNGFAGLGRSKKVRKASVANPARVLGCRHQRTYIEDLLSKRHVMRLFEADVTPSPTLLDRKLTSSCSARLFTNRTFSRRPSNNSLYIRNPAKRYAFTFPSPTDEFWYDAPNYASLSLSIEPPSFALLSLNSLFLSSVSLSLSLSLSLSYCPAFFLAFPIFHGSLLSSWLCRSVWRRLVDNDAK